jgi:hypothetical protein
MRTGFCVTLFICLAWPVSAEGSTQAHMVQVIHQAATTTSLRVIADPVTRTNQVSVSIQVTSPNGWVVPNGAVFVSDGPTLLGAFGIVNGNASGAVNIASLGSHQLVGCYGNTDNYMPSCSSPVAITLSSPVVPGSPTSPTPPNSPTPPGPPTPPASPFPPTSPAPPTFPAPPSSPAALYKLQQGIPSSVINAPNLFIDKLSVIPEKGFVGIVQLSCKVSAYQCELSPSSLTFSGDGRTQTVQVQFIPSMTILRGILGLSIFGLMRIRPQKRYSISSRLIVMMAVCAVFCLTGCGPNVFVPFNAQSYTMLVNSSSGTYSQAVTYEIQVDTNGSKQ